jgi:hypothetical protein
METKQTAVDWLKKKCQDSLDREPDDANEKEIGYSMALNHIITLIDLEAKQMEKDQTLDLMSNACMFFAASFHDHDLKTMTYEEVYNKYYNGN